MLSCIKWSEINFPRHVAVALHMLWSSVLSTCMNAIRVLKFIKIPPHLVSVSIVFFLQLRFFGWNSTSCLQCLSSANEYARKEGHLMEGGARGSSETPRINDGIEWKWRWWRWRKSSRSKWSWHSNCKIWNIPISHFTHIVSSYIEIC